MKSQLRMPIILASSSPRRIEFMNQMKLPIEVQSPDSDEKPLPNESPTHLVTRLAQDKANSVSKNLIQKYDSSLVIAADTIVVAPDGKTILGKPKNVGEARKFLKLLSGKRHSVLTGYCILLVHPKKKKQVLRVVKSQVTLRALSPKLIDRYIQLGEPMDKAGAYAAQGMGMGLIEKIQGSYSNVVGLPIAEVFQDLESSFKIRLFSWVKSSS